jgi:hypothetical protein
MNALDVCEHARQYEPMQQNLIQCPLCQQSETEIYFESKLKWSVRSDWTPLPVSSTVYKCSRCDHLFKPSALTQKWSDYQNYHVLGDNPEMDKMDFTTGMPVSRSMAIIKFLQDSDLYSETDAVLDYGCNRGAFVRLLNKNSAGYDVSEHYRPIIEKLGARYYTPKNPPPKNQFRLLTLLHVAEHLDPLGECLQDGLNALKKEGSVFIQVPDALEQPTDLYVMDHCSHFLPSTLDAMMKTVGLENIDTVKKILPGELTAVYRPKTISEAQPSSSPGNRQMMEKIVASLKKGEECLLRMKEEPKHLVFGAGLLGSMVGKFLGKSLKGFIDDNSSVHGRKLLEVQISSLEKLKPSDGVIVVAVPPTAAAKVTDKCRALGFQVETPFLPAIKS